MNPRDQRVMAFLLAIAALYVFEWKALYLFGIAGVIFWILHKRR